MSSIIDAVMGQFDGIIGRAAVRRWSPPIVMCSGIIGATAEGLVWRRSRPLAYYSRRGSHGGGVLCIGDDKRPFPTLPSRRGYVGTNMNLATPETSLYVLDRVH